MEEKNESTNFAMVGVGGRRKVGDVKKVSFHRKHERNLEKEKTDYLVLIWEGFGEKKNILFDMDMCGVGGVGGVVKQGSVKRYESEKYMGETQRKKKKPINRT